jgi:hypothetical protein
MSTLGKTILFLASLLFCATVYGQTRSEIFKFYQDKVKVIINDTTFQKVTISNKLYGTLTGYLRNGNVFIIVERYKEKYGLSECIFLFDRNKLSFVNKKQIRNKNLDSSSISSPSNADMSFEGLYLFQNEKIVREQIEGEESERDFDFGDPYPFKNNSGKYFLFLAKRHKKLLLQKRGSS